MITRLSRFAALLALMFTATIAVAGEPAPPVSTSLERWRMGRLHVYMDDFGELARYRDANARLAPPARDEARVVFFGDSITDQWDLAAYFPDRPYVNRGIGGQTTAQMLVRFRQDVIDLRPSAVLVLAGTNDIAGNSGPARLEDIESNLVSLAELAQAQGIRVIFASVLPVHNYSAAAAELYADRPMAKIRALNHWLQTWCAAHSATYLDYFSHMVDGQGLLRRELADDGLHPNEAGFRVMAPLAEAAIRSTLGAAGR
jgi:lysophospholipase L1-like esterase